MAGLSSRGSLASLANRSNLKRPYQRSCESDLHCTLLDRGSETGVLEMTQRSSDSKFFLMNNSNLVFAWSPCFTVYIRDQFLLVVWKLQFHSSRAKAVKEPEDSAPLREKPIIGHDPDSVLSTSHRNHFS